MNHNSEHAVDAPQSTGPQGPPHKGEPTHRARRSRKLTVKTGLAAALALALWSCSTAPPKADNARALSDISAQRNGAEEVIQGPVLSVLSNSHGPSGVHERFIVDVRAAGANLPLYVTDNISVGQVAPLRPGDVVTVKGELAYNDRGPLLHWTHRDPRMRHAPGFVEVGGHVYE